MWKSIWEALSVVSQKWSFPTALSKSKSYSEHPNPHYRLKWVVHRKPQTGTIGFDPCDDHDIVV